MVTLIGRLRLGDGRSRSFEALVMDVKSHKDRADDQICQRRIYDVHFFGLPIRSRTSLIVLAEIFFKCRRILSEI